MICILPRSIQLLMKIQKTLLAPIYRDVFAQSTQTTEICDHCPNMSLLKACLADTESTHVEHSQCVIHIDDYKPSMKNRIQCPQCSGALVAKMGFKNTHHYAHKSRSQCDSWTEPMTAWHRQWQDLFAPDHVEVVMMCADVKHIADIAFEGHVLEIQHSHISAVHVKEREEFYTKHGKSLTWVVDGRLDKDCVVLGTTWDNYAAIWATRSWWWHAKNPVLIDTNEGVFQIVSYIDKKVGVAQRVDRLSCLLDVIGGLTVSGEQRLQDMLSTGASDRTLTTTYEITSDSEDRCIDSRCSIAGTTYNHRKLLKDLGMKWNGFEWAITPDFNYSATMIRGNDMWLTVARKIEYDRELTISMVSS